MTDPTTARPAVGVGVLLFRPDGKILIGRRVKHGEQVSWCLPGGHLEANESFEEAALRETREEACIDGANPEVFTIAVHTSGCGVTVGVRADACGSAHSGEPQVFERWEWVDLDALPQPLFPPSAVLLAAWQHRSDPLGWSVHPVMTQQADR